MVHYYHYIYIYMYLCTTLLKHSEHESLLLLGPVIVLVEPLLAHAQNSKSEQETGIT